MALWLKVTDNTSSTPIVYEFKSPEFVVSTIVSSNSKDVAYSIADFDSTLISERESLASNIVDKDLDIEIYDGTTLQKSIVGVLLMYRISKSPDGVRRVTYKFIPKGQV